MVLQQQEIGVRPVVSFEALLSATFHVPSAKSENIILQSLTGIISS
jgi:hypothetical protein